MLVVTANWSFTDGTLVAGRGRHVDTWRAVVLGAAARAGLRADGRYAPVERIDLVFAGDTVDLLLTTAWRDEVRPWHHGTRAAARRMHVQRGAVLAAAPLLATVVDWVRHGMPVPAPDRWARPATTTVRVPVGAVAIPGLGDAWLAEGPWPADIVRQDTCRAGDVEIRHGGDHDPLASTTVTERGPSLAASLAIDLVAAHALRLADGVAGLRLVHGFLAAVEGIGPLDLPGAVARWCGASDRHVRGVFAEAWRRSVGGWFRTASGRHLDPTPAGDAVERLAGRLERAADGDPAVVAACEEDLVPLVPRALRAAGLLVLGHPPAGTAGPGIVCLGRPRPGSWAGGARLVHGETADVVSVADCGPAPVPPTIVCDRVAGRRTWQWVGDEPRASAPWWTGGPRVVEAA